MPLWAKYDRANGRIVAITDAPNPPPEDNQVAVIECASSARVGDFIGEGARGVAGKPVEPDNTLPESPDTPQGGQPPPPGQPSKPPPKDE